MEKFHRELDQLKIDVEKMGEHALGMLHDSVEALKGLDMDLADNVVQRKDWLMDEDDRIEAKALEFLTRYQPMASDLRVIATIFKIITYLTRIGRYGKDIANIVRKELEGKNHIKKIVSIPHMTDLVEKMIQDALDAFEHRKIDRVTVQHMEEVDDEVDDLRMSIFRECLTYMMEDAKNIPICLAYTMIARYLERCGDHACKMAEKIHYMVTGKRVEIK